MTEGTLIPSKRPLDEEIASIKAHLQEMGEWSIQMVIDGMTALGQGDTDLARRVVAKDDRLDAFDVDIEHEVIRVLVTRQPAARDARTLGSCLKVGTYLDRVGRLGLDIAKYVRQHPSKDQFPPWSILQIMQDQSIAMLRVALDAFDRGDIEKARAVYEADDAVDELNRQVIKECMHSLQREPGEAPHTLACVLATRPLERVADSACKIAEKTIYMETGHRRREFLTPENKVAL
jgi:phosphate transport system protein